MTWAILLSIGGAGPAAQRGVSVADPIRLPADSRRFATELEALFDPARSERWQAGFALVDRLGSAATSPLRALVARNDPDIRVRLLLIASLGIAGDDSALRELVELATRRESSERERFLAAFVLACSPGRSEIAPALEAERLVSRPGQEPPLLEAADLLALWRLRGKLPAASIDRLCDADDAAVAAAARILRPPSSFLQHERRRHAVLVQRAEFLGSPARAPSAEDLLRLQAIFAERDPAELPLRLAAGSWLARVPDPRGTAAALHDLPRDPEVLAVLAAEPAWRELLADRLRAPLDIVDAAWRARVALAFVLAAKPAEIARASWGQDPTLRAAACLGVAWRLGHANAQDVPEWCAELPDHPAREWIFIACGRPPRARDRATGVPSLDVLISTFDDARLMALDRTTVLDLTEEALQQIGAHFAGAGRQLELELIRDLLIAGSDRVAPVLGLPADRRVKYLPRGLAAGDNVFDVAYEFWRFVSARALPLRASDRLR